jgi:hypothetical protein
MRSLARHAAMAPHRLCHLVSDREHRIERSHRLLEDHRHAIAANGFEIPDGQMQHVLLTKRHSPARDTRRLGRQQAHHRERGHGFAAAALAHEAQCHPAPNREADAVDDVHARSAEADR